MKNIKTLRLTFVLLIAFFQIYDVEAQTNLPPISVRNNQNFQYSNYKFTPFDINPALAGSNGLYRVSFLIGDKYNNILKVPSKQFNFTTEYTFMDVFKDNDKVGFAMSVDLLGFAWTFCLLEFSIIRIQGILLKAKTVYPNNFVYKEKFGTNLT